ncbi:MAG: MOSC domain-containing protein [Candidatus Nanopelagicales bacterium]
MSPTPTVVALHVWPGDAPGPVARQRLDLTFDGAPEDRHAGQTMVSDTRTLKVYPRGTLIRNHRQLSLVSTEELALIAERLGIDHIAPGVIADNLCLTGLEDLTALPRLTRLEFSSGAVLMAGGVNTPCTLAGRMVEQSYGTPPAKFPKAAWGRRGITAWVDRPGAVEVGDNVTVHLPPG